MLVGVIAGLVLGLSLGRSQGDRGNILQLVSYLEWLVADNPEAKIYVQVSEQADLKRASAASELVSLRYGTTIDVGITSPVQFRDAVIRVKSWSGRKLELEVEHRSFSALIWVDGKGDFQDRFVRFKSRYE